MPKATLLALCLFLCLAADKPAAKPETIRDVADILKMLPPDAQPKGGEWNAAAKPKADLWFKENLSGMAFELTYTLKDIEYNKLPESAKPAGGWVVSLQLEPAPYTYQGAKFSSRLIAKPPADMPKKSGAPAGWLHVIADPELFKAAKGWTVGDKVTISGTVDFIRWGVFATKTGERVKTGSEIAMSNWSVVAAGKWKAQP